MKILVIQIARLGDIFLTWPALSSLRRQYPEASIELLVRKRFVGGVQGLEGIDRVWVLDTSRILDPLNFDQPDIAGALELLGDELSELASQKWDKIINLSFSATSSFLAKHLADSETDVSGYFRHDDGTLALPDDSSSYFFAQVGPGRDNRIHVSELMAAVSGVALAEGDWTRPAIGDPILPGNYLVVHVGASVENKRWSGAAWGEFIARLRQEWPGKFVLIGAADEKSVVDEILTVSGTERVISAVGQTSIENLFNLIGHAELLCGADSAPVHLASLTNTKTLNLSFKSVNFWETGPRAESSRILFADQPKDLDAVVVAAEALSMLTGSDSSSAFAKVEGPDRHFALVRADVDDFRWRLVEGIYITKLIPEPESRLFIKGVLRLNEANEAAVEQVRSILSGGNPLIASEILSRLDEAIDAIGRLIPDVAPIVRWYQAEKVRVSAGSLLAVGEATLSVHLALESLLKYYVGHRDALGESYA